MKDEVCHECRACQAAKVQLQLQLDRLQHLLMHEQGIRRGLEARLLSIHEDYARIIKEIREGKL